MTNEITSFFVTILAAGIRIATPVLFAAMGETIIEKSGVLNIGIEGTMLVGAFAGFAGAYFTGNPWVGIGIGILFSILIGLIISYLGVMRGADQIVMGILLNMFCLGVTSVFYANLFSSRMPVIDGLKSLIIPILSEIPILGSILFKHNPMIYLAFLLIPLLDIFINRTKFGMSLRAVGEFPRAADTAGINVFLTRFIGILIGSALIGLAGATLSVGQLGGFRDNMTAGRGFIALAIVVLGRWNAYGVLGGAMVFGITDAIQLRLQALGIGIPHQVLLMTPYLLTILVLVLITRGVQEPAALGKPYDK